MSEQELHQQFNSITEDRERRAKANRMIEWMQQQELPKTMMLDAGRNCTNLPAYIEQMINCLNNQSTKSLSFKLAYFRLYEVKKIIEKTKES